jgi:hypothetical protein
VLEPYFTRLKAILDRYAATPFVLHVKFSFETRPGGQGYLSGSVIFQDGSALHFSEFLDTTPSAIDKLMYTYHLVFRYDNARHRPPLASTDHKHIPGNVTIAPTPSLDDVLAEIATLKGWL